MLSEEFFLRGKSFLSVYKEALSTLSDVSAKSGYIESSEQFYNNLDSASKRNQIKFDTSGNILKGENWATSRFPTLYSLSNQYVISQLSEANSLDNFYKTLRSISDTLELQIRLEEAKKVSGSN